MMDSGDLEYLDILMETVEEQFSRRLDMVWETRIVVTQIKILIGMELIPQAPIIWDSYLVETLNNEKKFGNNRRKS